MKIQSDKVKVSEKEQVERDALIDSLKRKPDLEGFSLEVMADPAMIGMLLEIISTDTGSVKFYCDKVVRFVSERNPSLVYPYFNDIAELIDSPNNFVKWGAILTISNLLSVDDENRFEMIYDRYLSLLNSETMVTAANIAGNAWKIVRKHPGWEKDITQRLLKIEGNTYLYKGEPSPECRNIMFGHMLDCFDRYFDLSTSKEKMIGFAESQRNNPRKTVARKAEAFLKKHGTSR